MTTMRLRYTAAPGERFGPHAFDSQLGELVPLHLRETDDSPPVGSPGQARLTAVFIPFEGSYAELTYEILSPPDAMGAP